MNVSRIVVFYDVSFPYEGQRPNVSALKKLQDNYHVADAENLAEALVDADVLVHLHGSYFPKEAWNAILAHLRVGKGLLSVGGAPFKKPAIKMDGEWKVEKAQTGYHQQLQIHEALEVDPAPIAKLVHHRDIPLLQDHESLFTVEPTYGLVLHVTRTDDKPGELGSSGPIDAHIYPLLKGISGGSIEREVAAPVVLIENTKGDFAGGRWIFVNQPLREAFWSNGGADALGRWADFAALGVTELWLKPNYASYEPGDRATLMLQAQRLGARKEKAEWTFKLRVLKAKDTVVQTPTPDFIYRPKQFAEVWSTELRLHAGRELEFGKVRIPEPIQRGFYVAECEAVSSLGESRLLRQGFWGFDAELLKQGDYLTCDRDYFWKDGKPLPIVGMTYMTSDVARKYLFLPNAAVWDRDMAQMKRAGINLIRTGIWTAWRQIMFVDGHAYEEVLRAVDAFILTAKRYDLEVTFNFFSFTPENWEGVNPYLDPRSVEAQKRFISAIVSRHTDSKHVHWDLINEPSMFDPKRIFKGPRSLHDRFEKDAFIEFLKQRHGTLSLLQERWNMTPDDLPAFEAAQLLEPDDINFGTTETLAKKGGPWLDYTLFTMEMHNRWAKQLLETIRAIQPKQLVTVGQDEALTAQRPSPFFYADEVDYTTVHSWWSMDDLVWDGVFTKDAHKPNLIQETGIMYVETPDDRAKRSESELRNILERKYAYAFSTGGAGAVQWIWNINFYMNNVNESNIGALRADGTEKPEADVSYDFGSFMESIRELFVGRKLEDVAVIFPYSNDFSNRKLVTEATARAVRTLVYDMNVHVRGFGEYHLDSLADSSPKLILVPSAHNFSDEALERLIGHIRTNGGTLLFTGPVGLDAYWRPVRRLESELQAGEITNVRREEAIEIEGRIYPVSFGGARIADTNKQLVNGVAAKQATRLVEADLGKGRMIWCPLPVELGYRPDVLKALYSLALNRAGVTAELEWLEGGELPGVYGRKIEYAGGALYVFVSEYGHAARIHVKDPATDRSYAFTLDSERSVLFATDAKGELTAVYRPAEVSIAVS
ncbi:glycoside hydrolase [Gordoniibacillus kamchatkensis]|uniref:Glycoside hydrolase n=1 Tax=Gordoniibacillus kamchatkensis TaxID=1590651 RepID=A0ABR5ACU6_9BACL|nr:cellulase family glycosylhydrolase [Paenibacillus sp. VKM B-2647]KIL38876.1 glycoside hydrolase [Paenibacillus sp. VKM B-2647]